jgi:hypothetical protein
LTSPVVLLYLLAYFWIIKIPPESEELTRNDPDIQQEKEGLLENNEKDENGQLDEKNLHRRLSRVCICIIHLISNRKMNEPLTLFLIYFKLWQPY